MNDQMICAPGLRDWLQSCPGIYRALGFDELRAASTILRRKRFPFRTSDT